MHILRPTAASIGNRRKRQTLKSGTLGSIPIRATLRPSCQINGHGIADRVEAYGRYQERFGPAMTDCDQGAKPAGSPIRPGQLWFSGFAPQINRPEGAADLAAGGSSLLARKRDRARKRIAAAEAWDS